MPTYIYKAITSNGMIVKNRVDDVNKQVVITKLKRNNLMPISVIQLRRYGKKAN